MKRRTEKKTRKMIHITDGEMARMEALIQHYGLMSLFNLLMFLVSKEERDIAAETNKRPVGRPRKDEEKELSIDDPDHPNWESPEAKRTREAYGTPYRPPSDGS